ncbi:hypothetical protein POX30_01070 [Raoultella planticola]
MAQFLLPVEGPGLLQDWISQPLAIFASKQEGGLVLVVAGIWLIHMVEQGKTCF